jgi:hypothetical protein
MQFATIFFYYYIYMGSSPPTDTIVGLVAGVMHALLPMGKLNEKLFDV